MAAPHNDKPLPTANDVQMIMSDIDGTLLDPDHNLHPRTIHAFRELRKARPNFPIVLCSGKQYSSCVHIRKELDLPDAFPAGHCHGCCTMHRGAGGEIVQQSGLSHEVAMKIIEANVGTSTFMFMGDSVIQINADTRPQPEKDWVDLAKKYDTDVYDKSSPADREAYLKDFMNNRDKPCIKISLFAPEPELPGLRELCHRETGEDSHTFIITQALTNIIELIPSQINKGVAMHIFCQWLNVDVKGVMSFGDGDNDCEMLAQSGYGVSMGNAMKKPHETAPYKTLANSEGGVGWFIEQVFPEIPKWTPETKVPSRL